jgi:hypothetical protein
MGDDPVLGDQHHPVGAQGEQQVVHLELGQRLLQRVLTRDVEGRAQRRLELAPVRLEDGGAAEAEEVPELGSTTTECPGASRRSCAAVMSGSVRVPLL